MEYGDCAAHAGRALEADAARSSEGRWPRICERLGAVSAETARRDYVC
jgi:hypothetical protein